MTEESAPRQQAGPYPVPPPIPADEAERLLALHRLGILDTLPSESFDRITRLAAHALRVPILLLSLIDESRQWFKSCVGLDVTETSRDISFCGHVVFERRPIVVPDALQDVRFAHNPLVTGPPNIRSYMGIPLFTLDGQPIGTLCAIDVQPRYFRSQEIEILTMFAKIVEETIHAKELAAQTAAVLQVATDRERSSRTPSATVALSK
jgi:GAF domain-containing protein